LDDLPIHVLFVCSRNQWRSPTAEQVWRKHAGLSVRSCGTSRRVRRRLTVADIRWADLIFVMEQKHKSRIQADFRDETRFKPLYVLHIPDNYQYMDAELIELVREKVGPFIEDAMS
jgi:predicted protein tyrosine phosphatase